MFTPRTIRPEKGNKYYITRSNGGYSTAIKGNPTDTDNDVLSNCVGYAVGRFHEIAGCTAFNLIDSCNAENLFLNAQYHGLKTGDKPELGALIVWQAGETLSGSDGAGHVAVVERIDKNGDILTSESGYGCKNPFWTTLRRPPFSYGTNFKLLGFVYQPESIPNPYTYPTRTLKKGSVGNDVRWLQFALIQKGYLRKNEIDGVFGTITLGAVCAYQLENCLQVDGVCGKITRESLK